MYIPVQQSKGRKRLTTKQQMRRSKAGIWLACIVLLIGAAWGVWQARSNSGHASAADQSLRHDLPLLWEWSQGQLEGGAAAGSWSIRWDAAGDLGLADRLAELFFTDEEGRQLDKLVQNEGRTVSGYSAAYGGEVWVSLTEADEQSEKTLILLTPGKSGAVSGRQAGDSGQEPNQTAGQSKLEKADLLRAVAAVSAALSREKAEFTASMKVQGEAAFSDPVKELIKQASAKRIDAYEDAGTVSATLHSARLAASVRMDGGQSANLQVAARSLEDSGRSALTIGIPLITGEYSPPQTE